MIFHSKFQYSTACGLKIFLGGSVFDLRAFLLINLIKIFEGEEYFYDQCLKNTTIPTNSSTVCSSLRAYCKEQAVDIANIYSLSVSILGFGLFLVGILYDWLDVFRTRLILSTLISTSYGSD